MNWIACALGSLALASLACATVDVETEVEEGVDVSRFETFHTAPLVAYSAADPRDANALMSRIQSEVDRGLQQKGYRPGPEKDSDLKIQILLDSREQVRLTNAGDPDTDFYIPEQFSDTRLVIDLIDLESGARVWRGRGQSQLRKGGALIPESAERAVSRSVREILAELPARAANVR